MWLRFDAALEELRSLAETFIVRSRVPADGEGALQGETGSEPRYPVDLLVHRHARGRGDEDRIGGGDQR